MDISQLELDIRERGFPERFDLSLLILRNYFPSIAFWVLVCVLPLMAINVGVVYLLSTDFWEQGYWLGPWGLMAQLTFCEFPFAFAPLSIFLSRRIFGGHPTFKEVLATTFQRLGAMIWVHIFARLHFVFLFLSIACYLNENPGGFFTSVVFHYLWWNFIFALRPFTDLVLYLEQLPVRKRERDDLTVGKRSGLISGHNSVGQFIGMVGIFFAHLFAVGGIYTVALYAYYLFTENTVTQNWFGWFLIPLCFWLGQSISVIYVFVSYLDCRIRNEGWEIEIRMRIEAEKQFPADRNFLRAKSSKGADVGNESREVEAAV